MSGPSPTDPGSDPRRATTVVAGSGVAVNNVGSQWTISSAGTASMRLTTGSILASSTVSVTATWPNAFGDANYTPIASLVDASGFLMIQQIISFSNSQVVVSIKNNDGAGAHTGTLCLIGLHD